MYITHFLLSHALTCNFIHFLFKVISFGNKPWNYCHSPDSTVYMCGSHAYFDEEMNLFSSFLVGSVQLFACRQSILLREMCHLETKISIGCAYSIKPICYNEYSAKNFN